MKYYQFYFTIFSKLCLFQEIILYVVVTVFGRIFPIEKVPGLCRAEVIGLAGIRIRIYLFAPLGMHKTRHTIRVG